MKITDNPRVQIYVNKIKNKQKMVKIKLAINLNYFQKRK